MITHTVALILIVNGIIHLLPLSGLMSAERLVTLYGIEIMSADIELLLRHRAVLFGLLGAGSIWAAFKPSLHFPAIVAGLCSVVSFLVLAWRIGNENKAISTVITVDIIAAILLLIAVVLMVLNTHLVAKVL